MSDKTTRYFVRTVEHIHRVQKNMLRLVTEFKSVLGLSDEECRESMWNAMNHDRSKFSPDQFLPYIELTEYYRQRKTLRNAKYDYPTQAVKVSVDAAVADHYAVENHHPEKYKGEARQFTLVECLEIVCDLQAMAQEFGEGSCREFFEGIWRKKHLSYFQYDDFHYANSMSMMRKAISCFEFKG